MPVMDGLEASAKILELNTGIPIVAMTANIMSTDTDTYLKSGMRDCIGKPFTSQELWRLLLNYLKPVDMENAQNSAHVESNKEINKKFQMLFFKENKNRFSEITNALETGDIKEAHRFAHSLKSNAAQIGKSLLQQAAANVELKLKDGLNHVSEDQLYMLEAELNAVLNELKPILEEKSIEDNFKKSSTVHLDQQETRILFEKLEPLLRNGNSECFEYMETLKMIPGCEKLVEYIEEYEFRKALGELNRISGN